MIERTGQLAHQARFVPFDPDHVAAEPTPKRVRARLEGAFILDTTQALIAWIEGPTPDFAIPPDAFGPDIEPGATREHDALGSVQEIALAHGDAKTEPLGVRIQDPPEEATILADHVVLDWDAMDAWFVEDERQRGHPRDPYRRIDVHETSRPVTVSLNGQTVAHSKRALALFETGLPVRFYLPELDVSTEQLKPSSTQTRCAYKGQAAYHHVEASGRRVEDAVWSYPAPEPGFGRLQDRLSFDQSKIRVEVDGQVLG